MWIIGFPSFSGNISVTIYWLKMFHLFYVVFQSAKREHCPSHKGVAVAFQTFKSFKTHFGFSALTLCSVSECSSCRNVSSQTTTESKLWKAGTLQYVCLLPDFSLKAQTQQTSTDNRRYLHIWQVAPVYPVPSHVQLKLSHVCLHRPPCSQWLGIHL